MKVLNRKIEAVAPKKDVRAYLNGIYYDVEQKCIVATDGHILAKLAVKPDEGDESTLISHESIAQARKAGTGKLDARALVMRTQDRTVTFTDDSRHPAKPETRYPDYNRVIPNKEPVLEIGLDAKLLYQLAQGLCRHGNHLVKLSISNPDKAVRVTAVLPVDPDDVGVIMPVRIG